MNVCRKSLPPRPALSFGLCIIGEGISGALQWKELMKMATEIGFAPPVLVSSSLYKCEAEQITNMLGKAGLRKYCRELA